MSLLRIAFEDNRDQYYAGVLLKFSTVNEFQIEICNWNRFQTKFDQRIPCDVHGNVIDYLIAYKYVGTSKSHDETCAVDGKHPLSALVQGMDGAFYGTASEGGYSQDGTVFKLNTNGGGFSVLRHFGPGFNNTSLDFHGTELT